MADSYVGYSPADRLSLAPGSVSVGALNTTGTASSSTYLRGDMAWSTNPLGDVTGPGSSTDDALAKYDSTTGKVLQNSNATLTDAGLLTVSNVAATINTAAQPNITSLGTIASLVATTADINGGTVDDAIIGGASAAAGTFTTVTGNTSVTTAQVDITAQGDLRLQDTTGGEYVAIQAAGTTTTYTLTMPAAVATSTGQALTSSTGGVGSWTDVGDASLGTAQEWTAQQNFNGSTLAFDATQDWALTANQVTTLTLTANTVFDAPTQMVDGAFYSILIQQDGTGGWTCSFPAATFKWAAGTAPTLTTTASAKDLLVFRSNGTLMYEVGRQLNLS